MISILCPSRGRPELAAKMVATAQKTANTKIQILLYLNEDDPSLEEYKKLINNKIIRIGPDRSPAYSWNKLAEEAKHDICFLIGDDASFNTPGWDSIIIEEFKKWPDKIVCVYPPTKGLSANKNNHFCLHKNWINTLGYFVPPQFWHWYVDTWTRKVAQQLNRYVRLDRIDLDIVKKPNDETSRRVYKNSLRERDHYLWDKTSERWLNADVQELQQFIRNYK
jgi:hypothetical protein